MQEMLAHQKAEASSSVNEEVDLDELMDVCFADLSTTSSSMYVLQTFQSHHICSVTGLHNADFRILSWKSCMQIGLQLLRWQSTEVPRCKWCSNFCFTCVLYKFLCYSQLDLSSIERSRETRGMEEKRSWRIQGNNRRWFLRRSHWKWKGDLSLLP